MRRREFITLIGGAAAAWPLAAGAQQPDRMRRIGVIMGFGEDDKVRQVYLATFKRRLQDFGWSEGRNIRYDYHFTGDSTDRMRSAAAEVVGTAPDVIFVSTNPVVSAVQLTRTVPIVFTWVSSQAERLVVEPVPTSAGVIGKQSEAKLNPGVDRAVK